MAQKKVILKDGSDDLLPKTLASMVFTEAGQTVEAALQSAGGGSSSGGGTGNVNVTNASSLQKDAYYAFQPSAAGSLTGKFATIPTASASASGLMSNASKSKLDGMKEVVALPASVAEYTADTPSATIEADLESAFGEGLAAIKLIYIAASLSGDYNSGFPKVYIGDRECLLSGSVETDGGSPTGGTLELSYVTGGKLRTIAITLAIGRDDGNSETYTYSAKVEESGDDTYYIPTNLVNAVAGESIEALLRRIGGTNVISEIIHAICSSKPKKLYILDKYSFYDIPVSGVTTLSVSIDLFFIDPLNDLIKHIYINSAGTSGYVKYTYLEGYKLPPSLYSLSTTSTTDDISTAVGGESGLKKIIQAVKDGNRLVIRGALDGMEGFTADITVKSVLYQEAENGDMIFAFAFDLYFLMGYQTYYKTIQYTKSSNTFTCSGGEANMLS